jgi:hypothetical protein
MLTKRNDVYVEMSGSDNGSTDGKRIFQRPPLALGDLRPHQRKLCNKRDDALQLLCPACAIREEVLAVIYHEIAHIAFDSFAQTSDAEKQELIKEALAQHGSRFADKVRARVNAAPYYVKNSYIGMASLVNPFLPMIVNALEDARVNREMFRARKGTKVMFDALISKVFTEGVEQKDALTGKVVVKFWYDYPQNMQVILGTFCVISGYTGYHDWFVPPVAQALDDDVLVRLLKKMDTIRSAQGVYNLSFSVLARLRELGFCITEEDPDDEPQPPEGDEDASSSDDDGVGESDDNADESSGGRSEDLDENDDSDSDGSEDGEADHDSGPDEEAGDGSSMESSSSKEEGDEDLDDGSDSDEAGSSDTEGEVDPDAESDSEGDSSSSPEGDDTETSDEGDGGSEVGDSDGDSGESSDEDSDSSGDGSDGNLPPEDGQVGSGSSDLVEQEPSGDDGIQPASESAAERGTGDIEGDSLDDSRSEGDGEPSTDHREPGDASDSRDRDPAMGNADGTPDDTAEAESEDRVDGEGVDDGDSSSSDEDADREPIDDLIDTGADKGEGGTRVIPDDSDLPPMGGADEVEGALKQAGFHDDPPKTAQERRQEDRENKAVDKAIIQGMYFETPSSHVWGVREHRFDNPIMENGTNVSGAWEHNSWVHSGYSKKSLGIEGDFVPPESIMGPALLQMRRVFTDNARGSQERNLRSGRVNSRSLGRRAPFGDERLFQKKRLPGRKKYFVLVGVDISGSTIGRNIVLEKRAVTAQCELLSRMGIDFAVYAHTGSYKLDFSGLMLDIYHIKDANEPWDTSIQNRLHEIGPDSANLDGHTLEYYRHRLDESDATDKIIMYYTDGKMPAENHDEELIILQREIQICRQKNYTLMGVGIRTDSPVRHGLDTVQVDDDEDIPKVVQHLEKRLIRNVGR